MIVLGKQVRLGCGRKARAWFAAVAAGRGLMVTLLIQHVSVYFLRPLLVLLDLLKTKKGTTCLSIKNNENAHLADIFRLQHTVLDILRHSSSLSVCLW